MPYRQTRPSKGQSVSNKDVICWTGYESKGALQQIEPTLTICFSWHRRATSRQANCAHYVWHNAGTQRSNWRCRESVCKWPYSRGKRRKNLDVTLRIRNDDQRSMKENFSAQSLATAEVSWALVLNDCNRALISLKFRKSHLPEVQSR